MPTTYINTLQLELVIPEADRIRFEKELEAIPGAYDKALRAAINKTADKLGTIIRRRVAEVTGMGVRQVGTRLFLDHMETGGKYAKLKIGRYRWPLINYKPRWSRRGGVTATVLGKPVNYPHAFIRVGPKVGKQVFVRNIQPWDSAKGAPAWREEQRMKLQVLRGASPSEAWIEMGWRSEEVQAFIDQELVNQMESQFDRFLKK